MARMCMFMWHVHVYVHVHARRYGLTTVLQNCGLMIIPMAVGYVFDVARAHAPPVEPNPYAAVNLFFAGLALAGVVFAWLLRADPATRHALNTPGGMMPSAAPSLAPSPVIERRG